MMRELYYEKDRKRGIQKTMLWLVQEIGELSRALLEGNKSQVEEEIADVFAWLSSVANLLDIDLEQVAVNKYPGSCPRCGKNPCICEE